DSLADAVRAAAQNDNLLPLTRVRLADRRPKTALVRGIHVWRHRRELGGAGVNAFIDWLHAEPCANRSDILFRHPRELRETPVGKSERLQPAKRASVIW